MRILALALLALVLGCTPGSGVTVPPATSSASPPAPAPTVEEDSSGGGPAERKPALSACESAYERAAELGCPPNEGRDWIKGKCTTLESKVVLAIENAKSCMASRNTGGF